MNWQNKSLQHQKEIAMSQELTKAKGTTIDIMGDDLLKKMGGMGGEKVQSKDILIPRLSMIQKLSPQVNKKKAEFIDGAEVGDFCNVATGDIYKGSVIIIPCYFTTAYIEWGKNRSGLVNNFGDDASILKKTIRNEKNQNVLPNGNLVNETAQWYCLLQDGASWTRVFMPMSSTFLKHSRKWMTLIRNETIKTPDGEYWKPPLFWRCWKLTAVEESNDQGDWVTFKPEKDEVVIELDPSRALIKQCMSFYEDVKTSAVRGEIIEEEHGKTINGTAISTDNEEIPF